MNLFLKKEKRASRELHCSQKEFRESGTLFGFKITIDSMKTGSKCLNDYFDCDSKYNHWAEDDNKPLAGSSPYIMARKTVVEKLYEAQKLLPNGYHFRIFDAYRSIAVQQALWDYYKKKKRKEYPDVSEAELDKLTQYYVSFPSFNVLLPSLHNTGGAIDLTIVDKDGHELDMGCDFDDFSPKAWTSYYESECFISAGHEQIRDNRRLLYYIMSAVGFTNLPSEWWHFDYGDEKWALIQHKSPLYAGILDAKVKDIVSYPHMETVRELDEKQQHNIEQLILIHKQCGEMALEMLRNGE